MSLLTNYYHSVFLCVLDIGFRAGCLRTIFVHPSGTELKKQRSMSYSKPVGASRWANHSQERPEMGPLIISPLPSSSRGSAEVERNPSSPGDVKVFPWCHKNRFHLWLPAVNLNAVMVVHDISDFAKLTFLCLDSYMHMCKNQAQSWKRWIKFLQWIQVLFCWQYQLVAACILHW